MDTPHSPLPACADSRQFAAGDNAQDRPTTQNWNVLLRSLSLPCGATLPALTEGVKLIAQEDPSIPFEAVVGTPAGRYGPRLTFRHREGGRFTGLAARAGHPWGAPDWVGVRVRDGRPHLKFYFARARGLGDADPPAGAPDDLHPVMAAREGDREEVYWRCRRATGWRTFAQRCAALAGAEPPECRPLPRPAEYGFALSVARTRGAITAVTLFADHRCLPGDAETARQWAASMPEQEQRFYEAALGGVRALGPRPRHGWHGMLGWTLDAGGGSSRAASLLVPVV